eukprot:TRINITY_DN73060_c0_g1_i1.p1 TRINITY_DN73060_c0_g1~~TRINITY_DN73060_c0_g1_i1.p1  ORF type:complete len:592 (+),score=133.70 TRINITY_DN73060_c0_g1_i1:34-1809(+)
MVQIEEVDSGGSGDEAEDEKPRPWEQVGLDTAGAAKEKTLQNVEPSDHDAKEAKRVAGQFALAEQRRVKANTLVSEGDFEGARKLYEEAHQALHLVGNKEEDRRRYRKDSSVLNLNLAFVNLRLGKLDDVKRNATEVLTHDPQNVKALYRRGLARARLARQAALFQDAEAHDACEDLQAVLQIEPGNTDAQRELQTIRRELQEHQRDLARKQRSTWAGFYGPSSRDSAEAPVVKGPLPAVRPSLDKGRHLYVSAQGVTASLLDGLDLELREGWCVGLRPGDLQSREALVDLLTKRVKPQRGSIVFHRKKKPKERRNPLVTDNVLAGLAAGTLAVVLGILFLKLSLLQELTAILCCSIPLIVVISMWWPERFPPHALVLVFTSDAAARKHIFGNQKVEDLIEAQLPMSVRDTERTKRVQALLCAAGLCAVAEPETKPQSLPEKCMPEGAVFRDLSDNQQQMVHLLWCLTQQPDVLICDEPLANLDPAWHPRVLRLLKRMKQDCKTSLVYLSEDGAQLRFMSDSLGLLENGALRELGPTQEVLDFPRSQAMKRYVAAPSQASATRELQARCSALMDDPSMRANWLPNVMGYVP